jgi:integration host factor subunit alpha
MAGHTVTRAQLTEAVYQEVGLSRNESAELVESVIAEISRALERGDMVKISSFGSFAVRRKGQRVGRNPAGGAGLDGADSLRGGDGMGAQPRVALADAAQRRPGRPVREDPSRLAHESIRPRTGAVSGARASARGIE